MPDVIQTRQGLHRKGGVHTLKSPARHVCSRGEEETRGRTGMRVSKQPRAHRFLLLRALLGLLLLLVPLELRLCLQRHQAQARVIMRVCAVRPERRATALTDARLGALAQQPPTCVPIWNPLILSLVSCALEPCNEPKTPAGQPQPPARWPACAHARRRGNPAPQHRARDRRGASGRGGSATETARLPAHLLEFLGIEPPGELFWGIPHGSPRYL
jgi:hypothetical protein